MPLVSWGAKVWVLFRQSWFAPLSFLLTSFAWFFPHTLSHSSVRIFDHALTLATNRREPPRLAFGLIEAQKSPSLKAEPKVKINLNEVLLQAAESNARDLLFRRLHPSLIWLNQMVISQAEFNSDLPAQRSIASSRPERTSPIIVRDPSEAADRGDTVKAHIRLQDGLYVGDGAIELALESHGHTKFLEYADPKSGGFSLPALDEADKSSAFIVAKVRSTTGETLGKGKALLSQVSAFNQLDIHPVRNNISSTVGDYGQLADNSFQTPQNGSKLPFKAHAYNPTLSTDENLPASGLFEVSNIMHGSTALYRFEKETYQPELYLAQAGVEQQVPMLTKSVAAALLSIASEQRNHSIASENNSIVWGRVFADSSPAVGVRIDVDFADSSQIVYFNKMMLPDSTLNSTSANGFFAILHQPEGLREIRVFQGKSFLGFANVVVESNTVSPVSIALTKAKVLRSFSVTDAFDGTPQASNLKIQGLFDSILTSERNQYFVPDSDQTGFISIHPQDPVFLDETLAYNTSSDPGRIPVVSESWLNSIKSHFGNLLLENTAVVVGFVDSANYRAFLPHEADNETILFTYFDAKGNPVENPTEGGGFVLLNVPQGIESLVIVDQTNGSAWSQVYTSTNQSVFVAIPSF